MGCDLTSRHPGHSEVMARKERKNRRIHLVDIENVCGIARPEILDVHTIFGSTTWTSYARVRMTTLFSAAITAPHSRWALAGRVHD